MIRKKDEDHILDAHHYGKGPEDKGHDPENIPLRQSNGMMPVKTLLDGVKRARAYIAINYTQGAEGKDKGLLLEPAHIGLWFRGRNGAAIARIGRGIQITPA